jgi:hypothetical protein
MNVAIPQRQTHRAKLADLAHRLGPPYWQLRHSGDELVLIAGSRGYIKPVFGGLLVVLRRSADPTVVNGLLRSGVLAVGRGNAVVLARLPEDNDEAAMLRELLGLHRGGAER